MRPEHLNTDAVIACADLSDRAGASSFEIGWVHDDVPMEEAGWYATAIYRGAKLIVDEHRSPTGAALALAERILAGGTCRCGEPVTLADGQRGCRWRLMGQRWESGCDAPSIRMQAGQRGDHAAMVSALEGNRAQRRAARKGGGRG